MLKNVFVSLCLAALFFSGCTSVTNEKPSSPKLQQTADGIRQPVSDLARQIAEQNERVDRATAVVLDKEVSVGLKVSNFNRFRLKSIRQDVDHLLKNYYPGYEIHVTTDSKLFSELDKLYRAIETKKLPKREAKKKLQKINEDMKG